MGAPAWWLLDKCLILDKTFYSLLLEEEIAASVTAIFCSLSYFWMRLFFFRNYAMNYVIIMHIDGDNAIIVIRLDVKTLYFALRNSRGNGKDYL